MSTFTDARESDQKVDATLDKLRKVHVKPYWCEECGEECDVQYVDQGIGSYEFWGQRGVDRNVLPCSDCCEAICLDELGQPVDFSE